MGDKSAIEWTDATWNPATGCSKVSPGCAHCYAETLALNRLAGKKGYPGLPWTPENAKANVLMRPERLDQPLRWRKPRMVFVNSMSDLFHPQIPTAFLLQVFNVMNESRRHTFQVLTKRPKRQRDFMQLLHRCRDCRKLKVTVACKECGATAEDETFDGLPNVWLGTSIESREYVGRADLLRETPAAIRFISAEPLLGPLVYDAIGYENHGTPFGQEPINLDQWADGFDGPDLDLTDIDWLIVGGESGKDHRPIREEWVEDLRFCAEDQGTAFFFKQWGGRTPKAGGRELDGRTFDEMPVRM